MLKIKNAALAASAVEKAQYPEEKLAEIVFLGRSNVGKSSLINTLLNRKNLARISGAPGKTRLLNFYRFSFTCDGVEQAMYFVDLPGYGYAKVSRTERDKWLDMISEFLEERQGTKFCWQLVDIRHEPSVQDIEMHNILRNAGYKLMVVATKADKISRGQRARNLDVIAAALGMHREDIEVFSAVTREGKEQLLDIVEEFAKVNGRECIS